MSSYVASHYLAGALQSGTKYQFYSFVYYITFFEAQWVFNFLIVEDSIKSQNLQMGDLSVNFSLFKVNIMFNCHLDKIKPQSPMQNKSKYLWSTYFCTWS
jgi:hypothetical protein